MIFWWKKKKAPVEKPTEYIPLKETCAVLNPPCGKRGTHKVVDWLLCDEHYQTLVLDKSGS